MILLTQWLLVYILLIQIMAKIKALNLHIYSENAQPKSIHQNI